MICKIYKLFFQNYYNSIYKTHIATKIKLVAKN